MFQELWQDANNFIVAFGAGAIGQLTKLLLNEEKSSFWGYSVKLCGSGFLGILVYLLIQNLNLNPYTQAFVIAMAGVVGKGVLDILLPILNKILNMAGKLSK